MASPSQGAAECPSPMRSSQLFAKQSGRRRWSPEPGSPPVSLNAGVCVGEGGAGSGVREIPGLLRQSQAQSAALHISACMQLTERERRACPPLSQPPAPPATKDLLFAPPTPRPFFPATPSQREREREKETERFRNLSLPKEETYPANSVD